MKRFSVTVRNLIQIDVWADTEEEILGNTMKEIDSINQSLQQFQDELNYLQLFSDLDKDDISWEIDNDQMVELEELVLELIENKKKGQDCTEAESAEIKFFIFSNPDSPIINEIGKYFPCELSEAKTEREEA